MYPIPARPARGVLVRGAAAALCALLAAVEMEAQERPKAPPPDTAAVLLDAVVISAVRPVATTGGSSALLVNPDSLHVVPAPTLEQVLRALPFVSVRENSRGEAEITLRGSDSRQVAVLVDGAPLTLGWDHRTDPSLVPATGAQSILLVRGLHSLLHGPNVLGGVVEVGLGSASTTPPTGRLRARAGVDHLGGHSLSVGAEHPGRLAGGELRVRAGAGYRARPGLALPGGVADAGAGELRTNSDLRHADGYLAMRLARPSGAWLGVAGSGYRAERGVPPELHLREPRLWRYPEAARLLSVLSAGTGVRSTPVGTGDLEASLALDLGSTRIESYETLAFQRVEAVESSHDRTLSLRVVGDHALGRTGSLRGALTLADVRHDEAGDADPRQHFQQRLWSLGTEATLPLSSAVRVSGGVVVDGADTPESGDKPPLGRLWAWGARLGASGLALDRRLRLHAALSRRARFPSLRELYSGALGRFVPNPALQPERLVGLEAGGTGGWGALELQAVGFHHRLSDAIVRAGAGGGRFRRENRDQIRSTGVELLADWQRHPLQLTGDLLLQQVRVVDPGAPAAARRPEHQPGLRAGLNAEVALPLRLRGILRSEYVGEQFCVHPERGSDVSLPGSGRVDAGVQRTWRGARRAVRATVLLDNLGDAAAFDQCGLPQPGRTLRLAFEVG